MILYGLRVRRTFLAVILCVVSTARGQSGAGPSAVEPPSELSAVVPRSELTDRWALLPTDRYLRSEQPLPPGPIIAEGTPTVDDTAPPDWKRLLRPGVELSAEWEPAVGGLSIASYDASLQMPLYPIFGPPPPLVTSGYAFTQIEAPARLDLPSNLHEFTLGLAWMRRINEQWMGRLTISGALASDLVNTGHEAWQLRGGGFAIYRPNPRWTWALGALATGRNDIPVLPAAGVIWEPSDQLKVNLMMPSPRVAFLLADDGSRQHWGYVGAGLSGGTWAYERSSGLDERLNYREWRLLLGWESTPPQPPGTFRPLGTTFHAEVAYVLGREFEFDNGIPDIAVDDGLLLRTGVRF